MDNPVNEEISYMDDDTTYTGRIVGVVEDFNFKSLHQTISPLIIQMLPDEFNYLIVKLTPENMQEQLSRIQKIWKQFDPLYDFEYSFLDSEFESNYRQDKKAGSILLLFSGLSVLIACMGLFGLTSFAVQTRVKEIGIRKVMGAGISGIVALFSKEFVQLILVSFLISVPATIWLMNTWLQSFAYKTEIGAGLFVITSLIVLVTAQLTIVGITIKAAVANPVESLRNE